MVGQVRVCQANLGRSAPYPDRRASTYLVQEIRKTRRIGVPVASTLVVYAGDRRKTRRCRGLGERPG